MVDGEALSDFKILNPETGNVVTINMKIKEGAILKILEKIMLSLERLSTK